MPITSYEYNFKPNNADSQSCLHLSLSTLDELKFDPVRDRFSIKTLILCLCKLQGFIKPLKVDAQVERYLSRDVYDYYELSNVNNDNNVNGDNLKSVFIILDKNKPLNKDENKNKIYEVLCQMDKTHYLNTKRLFMFVNSCRIVDEKEQKLYKRKCQECLDYIDKETRQHLQEIVTISRPPPTKPIKKSVGLATLTTAGGSSLKPRLTYQKSTLTRYHPYKPAKFKRAKRK